MIKKHPFEPFRIKSIEHITITTRQEREEACNRAGNNLFNLTSDEVMIDLLTDSGTGAMSSEQWAALMRGDESYAGARSFRRLKKNVEEIFGFDYFLPTHQGRAAEGILAAITLKDNNIVPSNTHFDTTAANILSRNAVPVNLVIEEGGDPNSNHPFKGNVDLQKLRHLLEEEGDNVPFCMVTVTNNAGGGQPVSIENIEGIRKICDEFDKPLFIDSCRFAENSWLVKLREEKYSSWSVKDIAKYMFSLADGATFSAKKDAIVNIGGLLLFNDKKLFKMAKNELIMREGFPTYGGLAGRDLDAMAVGLQEGCDESYLKYRTEQVAWLYEGLVASGVPVVGPPGGHAVYIDAGAMLPHIPASEFPAQALSLEAYIEGGIRGVEVGSVMLAHTRPDTGEIIYPPLELVRFAIPRRTYTESHLKHVVNTMAKVAQNSTKINGVKIVEAPEFLRHFTATFAQV